jgi:hypothetical protein
LLEHGEDFVLYAMLDFVTENYQPMGEAIHAQIDELERNVMCGSLNERDIQNLHSLRRDVVRLRRYAAPMVEIARNCKAELPVHRQEHAPVLPRCADSRHAADGRPDDPGDIASQTIEIGVLLEASRQSVVQRKFAAWAAILAFPTAVAGIYGMNFQNMPELSWHYGYFAVLGFISVGCVGCGRASRGRAGSDKQLARERSLPQGAAVLHSLVFWLVRHKAHHPLGHCGALVLVLQAGHLSDNLSPRLLANFQQRARIVVDELRVALEAQHLVAMWYAANGQKSLEAITVAFSGNG